MGYLILLGAAKRSGIIITPCAHTGASEDAVSVDEGKVKEEEEAEAKCKTKAVLLLILLFVPQLLCEW